MIACGAEVAAPLRRSFLSEDEEALFIVVPIHPVVSAGEAIVCLEGGEVFDEVWVLLGSQFGFCA